MKNLLILFLLTALPAIAFTQNLSIEFQGGAQVIAPRQDYFAYTSRLNSFDDRSRFGLGFSYELPKNMYTKVLIEHSKVDFVTKKFTNIFNYADYSLRFSDQIDSYRKQISSSLLLGYEIPKTWLYLEGGVSLLYNYEYSINSQVISTNISGEILLESLENGQSKTLGYQAGFGIKADGRNFTSEKLNRYYMKFGHNIIVEHPGNTVKEQNIPLSTAGITISLSLGIRL